MASQQLDGLLMAKVTRGSLSIEVQARWHPQNRSRELQATAVKPVSCELPYTRSRCARNWRRGLFTPPEKLPS